MLTYVLLCASIALNLWVMLNLNRRLRRGKKARKNYQDFVNELNDGNLIHVYTDSFGNKWFTWPVPAQMPPERALMAEIAASSFDMNMNREDMVKYVEDCLNHCNKGKLTEVVKILSNMQERLQYAAMTETLLSLAQCYFMLDGENLRQPSPADSKRKSDIWEQDAECRAFFLRAAFKHTAIYSLMSETDILTYLSKVELVLKEKTSQSRSENI